MKPPKYPITFQCDFCGEDSVKEKGHVNRARRDGNHIYCDRVCSSYARMDHFITDEEKRMLKSGYDQMYKMLNPPDKAKAAAYFQRTYDPLKAAVIRKKNMHKHVEYCKRPEYRAWKRKYDQKFCAKQKYGEHWESAILLRQIRDVVDNHEAKLTNGLLSKSQKRKRDYGKLNSITLER